LGYSRASLPGGTLVTVKPAHQSTQKKRTAEKRGPPPSAPAASLN